MAISSAPRDYRTLIAAASLILGPLLMAIGDLLHPEERMTPPEQIAILVDHASRWYTAHLLLFVGMMLFIPLMAGGIYLLLRGVEGTAARVSRIALVPFVVFFSAWETLQGTANGILVNELNRLPEQERAAGARLIQDFAESPLVRDLGVFASIGSLSILIAMIAAGIALRRHAGAPLAVPILLGLFGVLIGAHTPPFGPIALVCFAAAAVLFWRSRPTTVGSARGRDSTVPHTEGTSPA